MKETENCMTNQEYDVIVVGCGPAGCTTATLIAQKGYQVLLLERDELPSFKVGESLIPGTYWTLKRLGMIDQMKESHFPEKYSVQFYSQTGKPSASFYFFENDPHVCSMTWQVLRSEFDQMLVINAEKHGVEVRRGTHVHQVLFDDKKAVGVRAKLKPDKDIRDFKAKVIVDSTGQSALISRKLKMNVADPKLKNASIFTHFEGAFRDEGIDEGATLILHTENKDSWFWYIPLPHDRVSVGVVGSIDYLMRAKEKGLQTIFDSQIKQCKPLQEKLENAKQVFSVKVTKDFSYRSKQIAGDHWVLVGDALGFLDPVYSSGILLAFKSGEMAADCIERAFERNDFSAEQLGAFETEFISGMEAFRKLVYAFYSKEFSFAKFLKRFPKCKQGVIDILSGNVFKQEVHEIFKPMQTMCPVLEDLSA